MAGLSEWTQPAVELAPDPPELTRTPAVAQNPISASQQFAAVSWLRWRIFRNAFRRKGGKGELVARIIVYPFFFGFLLLIIGIAGAGGYFAGTSDRVERLGIIFLGITLFQLLVSINIAPPSLSFDPESLIRFPLGLGRYLTIRLFLGILSASTVLGTSALLAAAFGVTLARHNLGLAAFTAAILLAVTNMLFVRMVFAWVDRWLSTRRAREILTAIIFLFSVGMQYLNITFNNIGHGSTNAARAAKIAAGIRFYHSAQGLLTFLPSGRAAASVLAFQQGLPLLAVSELVTLLLYAAFFFAVFGYRIEREYRGENLSEGSVQIAPGASVASHRAIAYTPAVAGNLAPLPNTLYASVNICLYKEWIYVRRNTAQLYSMLAPLVMVLLFAGRLGSFSRTGFTYPAAVAYALLGTAALAYNSFGLDGPGIQFYFLAPVELRTVVFAKNLFAFAINILQLLLVYVFLLLIHAPFRPYVIVITILWAILAALLNAAVGNRRSLSAPVKLDPGKMQRRQASGLSALISLGLILITIAVGAGLIIGSTFLGKPWLPIPVLAVLAAAALAFYLHGLKSVDQAAYDNRETMIEALCKNSG
jgi:ABC-2 type transport system permease protein